jgi:hypothetical protein
VVILSVTKFRPGLQTITLASVILMIGFHSSYQHIRDRKKNSYHREDQPPLTTRTCA